MHAGTSTQKHTQQQQQRGSSREWTRLTLHSTGSAASHDTPVAAWVTPKPAPLIGFSTPQSTVLVGSEDTMAAQLSLLHTLPLPRLLLSYAVLFVPRSQPLRYEESAPSRLM